MVSHLVLPYEWVECSNASSCLHVIHSPFSHSELNAMPRVWVRAMFPDCEIAADSLCWVDENKQMHREDGPAFEDDEGTVMWYQHGRIHRSGSPAVIEANGSEEWWVDGKLHRVDGPAVTTPDGVAEWWMNDELYVWDDVEGLPKQVMVKAPSA